MRISLPPFSSRPSMYLQAAGAALAVGVLTWGALPYLPGQIDDTYIVFAYAHNLVERGEIVWNTGARVEGYSSALHLAILSLAAALGADLALFAKGLSFACAVGTIASLARPRLGPDRALLFLLLAAWQPFQFWATAGLETAMATLLGALAWPLVLGRRREWAAGVLLLVALSVTRPEGVAWLGLALARRLTLGRETGRPEALVLAGLTTFAGYHAARAAYFGAFLPTPYLVKIVAIERFGTGAEQLSRELLSAAVLLLATLVFRGIGSFWTWAPLLVQAGLLVRAGGDWMGHGRFLVPGLVASLAAAWTHGAPRPRPWAVFGVAAVAGALTFAWEPSREGMADGRGVLVPGWRNPFYLRHPDEALRAPWAAALLGETSFLVERIPPGAGAAISDVGLPGNLTDVRIWDNAGLTDRVTARILASESGDIVQEVMERYHDDDDIWCLRYGRSSAGEETADPWLIELLPEVAPSRSGSPHMVWRCREGGVPAPEVVASRWGALVERFPSQDWIRWHYARSLIALDRVEEASEAVRGATWLADEGLGWILFGEAQGPDYHRGRGWALYANGARASLVASERLWGGRRLVLDVDDPGEAGAAVTIRWEPACAAALETAVRGRTTLAPPACVPGSGHRRLVVEFRNDEARSGFDRNLYVSLEAAPR